MYMDIYAKMWNCLFIKNLLLKHVLLVTVNRNVTVLAGWRRYMERKNRPGHCRPMRTPRDRTSTSFRPRTPINKRLPRYPAVRDPTSKSSQVMSQSSPVIRTVLRGFRRTSTRSLLSWEITSTSWSSGRENCPSLKWGLKNSMLL